MLGRLVWVDAVDPGELLQRELGNPAFDGYVQVEEFAARMRQAANLCHPTGDQRLVAVEVVTGQAALPRP